MVNEMDLKVKLSDDPEFCPKCGGEMWEYEIEDFDGVVYCVMRCNNCGYEVVVGIGGDV